MELEDSPPSPTRGTNALKFWFSSKANWMSAAFNVLLFAIIVGVLYAIISTEVYCDSDNSTGKNFLLGLLSTVN